MSTAFEQYVKVTLGDHNHKDKVKPSPIQHYHVTKVYHRFILCDPELCGVQVTIHPNFTNTLHTRPNGYIEASPRHDAALLRLDRPAKVYLLDIKLVISIIIST